MLTLLQNMVGPGDVDSELEPEVAEECSKYGEVVKVLIYEVGVPSDSRLVVHWAFELRPGPKVTTGPLIRNLRYLQE